MNDEVDVFCFGDADFKQSTSPVSTNQHYQITNVKYSYRVSICVEDVVVRNVVFASTEDDDGIHVVNIS